MFRNGKWIHKEPNYEEMAKNKLELQRYFEREQNRFDKGFQGLDGDYYMYLTQFMLRNRTTGEKYFPKLREVDKEIIFPWLKKCERDKMDGMWLTQRGAGKSTLIAGYLPLKIAIKYSGSKTIMTSESVKTTTTNFNEKLKVAYDEMNDYFKPALIGTWPPESSDQQFVLFGHRDKKGKTLGSGSRIQSIETAKDAKSPTKLEGEGSMAVIVDEIFKHPYVDEVLSKGGPLVREMMRKTGSMYLVGSLSDAHAKGKKNAIEMWTNAKTLGIEPLFVDATWFNTEIPVYSEDGVLIPNKYTDVTRKDGSIDRKKAREAILANRKILEKLPIKKYSMEYMMMYPLEVNELLDVAGDSWWDDEEVLMYKEQKKIVTDAAVRHDYDLVDKPAMLYRNSEGNVTVSYDTKREHAKFFIFEPPMYINPETGQHRTYGVGVDTIPGNSDKPDEGSLHAAIVKCFDTNQYVALYLERSTDMMQLAKKTLMLQEYYFDALALVERNSIGAMKLAYEVEGKYKLLANNPRRFRPKGQKIIEKGLHKGQNTPELRQYVRSYFSENMYIMNILRVFEEFLQFPFENTDAMDAIAMAEALHDDYKRKSLDLSKKQEERNPIVTHYVTDRNGVRRMQTNYNPIRPDGTLDVLSLISGNKRK